MLPFFAAWVVRAVLRPVLLAAAGLLLGSLVADPALGSPRVSRPHVGQAVAPVISDPSRAIPRVFERRAIDPPALRGPPPRKTGETGPALGPGAAPVLPNAPIAAPIRNWDGISSAAANTAGVPDTNGEVGPAHFVQSVNWAYAVYDKDGNLLQGPLRENAPFSGRPATDICRANDSGDPIVLYDQLADRWLLSYFAFPRDANNNPTAPFYECVAISSTPDPTGTWCSYAFAMAPHFGTDFPDYPKFGVWPDGYFMSANVFAGSDVYGGAVAFERAAMLNCQAARSVSFKVTDVNKGLLPSDLEGETLPPAGAGNPFLVPDPSAFVMRRYLFRPNWGGTASFAGPTNIAVASYDPTVCASGGCVAQPGTSTKLDAIDRDQLMHRLTYRRFATHEALVVNQTVNAGAEVAGVRFYEVRGPLGPAPTTFQQGTLPATDGVHRWMGSAAIDGLGNLAIGYNVSSSTVFPGIRYAGRQPGDPAGTLPLGEGTLVEGGGSKTGLLSGRARWGDYSAMSVDPDDDCTFWFTGEYVKTTSAHGWATRIGAFRLPGCAPNEAPQASFTANPNPATAGATVTFTDTSSDPDGTIQARAWDLDDGSAFDDGTGATASRSFPAPGSYEVRLRVTDDDGATAVASRTVTVVGPPQTTLAPSGPTGVTSQTTATFTFSSDDATADFFCALDEGDFEPCTSPKTYTGLADGDHEFLVAAVNDAGADPTPASRTWTVDTVAPETDLDTTPPASTTATSASFAFSSPDATASFECKLDTAAFAECTSPKAYADLDLGPHTFTVRALDEAGNRDASPSVHNWTIVEPAPPETLITGGPDGVVVASRAATFTFTSSPLGATFRCRLDRVGGFIACSSPLSFTTLSEGLHELEVAATLGGRTDPTPAVATWSVDVTTPRTTITSGPPAHSASGSASFAFQVDDQDATTSCRIDGAAFSPCSSPREYSALAEGQHVFEVRAGDPAGNLESPPQRREWTVDTTAPDTQVDSGPPPLDRDPMPTFGFSSSDPAAGFECRLDLDAFAPCSSPLRAFAPDGARTFFVRAVDLAGNVDATPAARRWTLDSLAPDTRIDGGPSGTTRDTRASFALGASETVSRFECRLDGGPFAVCGSNVAYAGLAAGGHNFEARAVDEAGNVDPTSAQRAWTVETTPTRPRLLVAMRRRSRLGELRRRGLAAFVTCEAPCRASLSLRVDNRTRRRLRLPSRTMGREAAEIRESETLEFVVELSRRARRALRGVRRVRLTLVGRATPVSGGPAETRTTTFTARR